MTQTWEQFINTKCYEMEHGLHIKPFNNKKLLIKALTRRALLNENIEFKEKFEEIGDQKGLDTLGDAIIDLVITEKAYNNDIFTRKDLTEFWKKYGNNLTLHRYSNECLKLDDYIIWGPDEKSKFEERNKQANCKFLAPCFEALVGVIYLDQGIDCVKNFLDDNDFFNKIDQLQ